MKLKCLLALLMFSASIRVHAVTIGSDSAVSTFNAQQTIGTGDRIAGFAAINGGFSFIDQSVTATFDSVFPVAGLIQLQGGTLILNEDLVLQRNGIVQTLGSIRGQGHQLELSNEASQVPTRRIFDCAIDFVTSATQLTGVNEVSWSFDNQFLAVAILQSTATPQVRIYRLVNDTLTAVAELAFPQTAQAVAWHPTRYLLAIALAGSIAQIGELLLYSFDPTTFALTRRDLIDFGADTAITLDWHPSGNYLGVGTNISANEVIVYPLTIDDCAPAFTFDRTNIATANVVGQANEISWNPAGNFMAIATTFINPNATLYVARFDTTPANMLTVTTSLVLNSVTAVDWNPVAADVIAAGLFTVTPRLRLYRYNTATSTLTQIVTATVATSQDVEWHPYGDCFAFAQTLNASDGELKLYAFNANTNTLTVRNNFDSGAENGTSVAWTPNGKYLAHGLSGGNSRVDLYRTREVTPFWQWSAVDTVLNGDVTLKDSFIRMIGANSVLGQGHILSLANTFTMSIQPSGNMLFDNITVQGLGSGYIQNTDATSTVTFRDANLIFDANYSFTVGRLDIVRDVYVRGANKVVTYRSPQPLTITSNSRLILDEGVTFSFDPLGNPSTSISLQDSGQIVLAGGTFVSTATAGFQLTKGTLTIPRSSLLTGTGSQGSVAITIGDGASSANNTALRLAPAAQLSLGGRITLNNV